MITIEGQDFYNFAEAILHLFSIVGDNYTKEELDIIIKRLQTEISGKSDLTIEQVRQIVQEELGVIENGTY